MSCTTELINEIHIQKTERNTENEHSRVEFLNKMNSSKLSLRANNRLYSLERHGGLLASTHNEHLTYFNYKFNVKTSYYQ